MIREELEKTLSLFSGSDFIFLSYGEEREGEYIPHAKSLRIVPDISLVAEAISATPLLPNDFGVMPLKWKAKSEDDKTYMLLERKLSRWSEGELFAHGYVIIDRILLDIDLGELDEREALRYARTKLPGVGKVAYTGGGLLAVVELSGSLEVRDRETFRRIKERLLSELSGWLQFDPQSLNLGKGVRLIGTHSRKRRVTTKWLLWEEGKKHDLFALIFGVEEKILRQAPDPLKKKIKEKFGIEIKGGVRRVDPEEVFRKAREFYGELDGRRNEFMLSLSGELLKAGVSKDRAIDLYLEWLADLEKRDKPSVRVKQTIEWVYREGREYRLRGEYPEDFLSLVKGMRGEEVSLSWEEFARELVGREESLFALLRLAGEKVYEDSALAFHLPTKVITGALRCSWTEEGERKEGRKLVKVQMELPPCILSALEEYEKLEGGEVEWYAENLLQVAFLLPPDHFRISPPIEELIDNPLAEAVSLMTAGKGLSRKEVDIDKVKKKVLRKSDAIFRLVRCMNPLLVSRCTSECKYYRFKHFLPEVLKKKIDKKTGEVKEALVRVQKEEVKVKGTALESPGKLRSFLEKRGLFLPSIAVEWLYAWIMKYSESEYVDSEREDFLFALEEMLVNFGDYYVDGVSQKEVRIAGKKFIELLQAMGYRGQGAMLRRLREEIGLKVKKTKYGNYTVVPRELLGDETFLTCVHHALAEVADLLSAVAEIKLRIEKEDVADEDYVLGRKAYILPANEGFTIYFANRCKTFPDGAWAQAQKWIEEHKEEEHEETEELSF